MDRADFAYGAAQGDLLVAGGSCGPSRKQRRRQQHGRAAATEAAVVAKVVAADKAVAVRHVAAMLVLRQLMESKASAAFAARGVVPTPEDFLADVLQREVAFLES